VQRMLSSTLFLGIACGAFAAGQSGDKSSSKPAAEKPWFLTSVSRPAVPAGFTKSDNPIDAFVAAQRQAKGLKSAGRADKRALLRRVYLDLIGIPPTIEEQDAFLNDTSVDAYQKVVDRLLASEQHGVRYARHWLDVLRYADADEGMIAANGIHLWREWVIRALNSDMPYDQFVCTQLTGHRNTVHTQINAIGFQERVLPRPDDVFALGFLARGAVVHGDKEMQELPIAAVETVSTAFLGLTVGCAKCHDHMYDPISQRDFYRMKALFDPQTLKKVVLANAAEIAAHGKKIDLLDREMAAVEKPLLELIAPYKKKLFDERVRQLPADVQAVILKPQKLRTVEEEKIADDYFPILRIDVAKIMGIMPEAERKRYDSLVKEYTRLQSAKADAALPAFWTVEVDHKKEMEKSYILTSGDPLRPEKNHEVGPGWPFAPSKIDVRHGRIEAFAEWLTDRANPLFARVAVNRLWQWHFGQGLQKTSSDFGTLGGMPSNPQLLDWLAAEFVRCNFSMKAMHRLIVTSETYRLASSVEPALLEANRKIDPTNKCLWHYPLRRLDAETVWDSIFSTAGSLDVSLGGPSFDPRATAKPAKEPGVKDQVMNLLQKYRRGIYIRRGYASNRDVMPAFLQAFDADDGRAPCPLRTHTITAPQALFLMNSDVIDQASLKFAGRIRKASGGNMTSAVDLAYRTALARSPSAAEVSRALTFLDNDPDRLPGLAWILFNLDEFVFVR
jgi:Protein of unknown function (DUF1553)/Protein of unknown function (DUF1549)